MKYKYTSTNIIMITILGKKYTRNQDENKEFDKRFQSIPYFSYKYNFPHFENSLLNSDIGWGCTYRCGQMLLCNVLNDLNKKHYNNHQENNHEEENRKILNLFDDTITQPFSIHTMVKAVGDIYNYNIGTWLGPCTLSFTLKKIVSDFSSFNKNIILPNIYITNDSIIYKNEITKFPVLVLLPLQLGLNYINSYFTSILFEILDHRLCMGIIAGKPKASFFIIGHTETNFLYLDPHEITNNNIKNKHYIHTSDLDSSILLSFMCLNSIDLDVLQQFTNNLEKSFPSTYVYSFKDENLNYKITDNLDLNLDIDFEL